MLRRRLHLTVATAVGLVVSLASLAGVARASGSSAAQDQYKPAPIVQPAGGNGPLTPPGAQASAPLGSQGASTLPFTGLSLLKVVLVGAGLLLLGVLLRRSVPRRGP